MFVQNTTGLDAFVPATYSVASGTTLTALLQGVNLVTCQQMERQTLSQPHCQMLRHGHF
jgi:hypothetical protein